MKKMMFCAVFLAAMGGTASAAEEHRAFDPQELYRRLAPSVVMVTAVETVPHGALNRTVDLLNPGKLPGNVLLFAFYPLIVIVNGPLKAGGSGVIIDESGLFITNWHVVKGSDIYWATLNDGSVVRARLLASDEAEDIALLRMELGPGQKVTTAAMGDSDALVSGEPVLAIGSPLRLHQTVSRGIVSGLDRRVMGPYQDFIQTDLYIGSGSSGGPLFNARGEVIGLTTRVFSSGGLTGGMSLSIPINVVKDALPAMKEKKEVVRGFVGAYVQTLTPRIAKEMKLAVPVKEGAVIAGIEKDFWAGSPADDAGLRKGDVVVKYGDRKIDRGHTLARAVLATTPGTAVTVEFYRGKELKKVTVKVAER